MAFSRVNYTEPKQSTYESIELSYKVKNKEVIKFFDSGNIIIDYIDYYKFLGDQDDQWYKDNFHISGSSSWDHFFMDGNKYRESYFYPDTGEFIDWRRGLDKNASNEERQLFHDVCDHKYPTVIHLSAHKCLADVKRYYNKKIKNRVGVSEEIA